MENYTKYQLKSNEELASLLEGKDNLYVIACNKCFKEFDTIDEPDCDEFLKFAAEQGKTVTGSTKVDFLCNKMHTERKLQDLFPEGTENVIVISCGLGIQTVAELAGKPVYAASNSLNYRGHHGMALTKKSCDACAQCYLNITGGVCPIVDCSKSLVNGQCGGAKNGKCEVDPNKDCAWEKIYQRLAKQGRLEEFLNQPVQVRDFSKVNFKVINDYVKAIREDRLNGYYGGVHPSEHKEFSEHIDLKKFPDPKTVVISMSQHLGAPANPIVQVGDTVRAAFSGKVRITKYEARGYGYYVLLRHPNGLETIYGHLSKILVRPNQIVKVGDPIALGGNTGRSTGPHLHFETRFLGLDINPNEIFDFVNQVPHTDTYVFRAKTSVKNVYSARTAASKSGNNGSKYVTYRVKKGDTLSSIAVKYRTTVNTLCRLNGISKNKILRLGQPIRVK